MFRVSTTPIIKSTQKCNYSLRYWSYFCDCFCSCWEEHSLKVNCPTVCNTKQSIYYSANSVYMFRVSTNPSSGVHKNVTTASGTGHIFCVQLPPSNVAKALATLDGGSCTKILPVPEAVVRVLCTPDDRLVDTRNM